jgi:hypothetical protein
MNTFLIFLIARVRWFSKDAGFVHESLRNETNRIFWDFWSYETNPRNESYENCVTKRIHETNLLNTVGRNESTKRIFWKAEGFANPKLPSKVRLCSKDSPGFVRIRWFRWNVSRNESTKRILWKLCHETNPRNESYENCVTKRIHETNLLKTRRIRIRGLPNPDSRNESTFLRISYTIPASLWFRVTNWMVCLTPYPLEHKGLVNILFCRTSHTIRHISLSINLMVGNLFLPHWKNSTLL